LAGEPLQQPAAPLYQTDLAQTSLPEILVKIHRYRVPGVLEFRRGDEVKRVFFDKGHIIFATTNQLTESLGDKLVRVGRITQDEYDESVRRMKITGKRHGVTLVEMKLLTAEEMFNYVREQIEEIVLSIFTWTTGTVAFTPGRDKNLEFVKVDIPVPAAVLRGARVLPDAKALVAKLGTRTTLFERATTDVEQIVLSEAEQHLLDAVDGRRALADLVNVPALPAADNARILYAFLALGLIAPHEPRGVKVQVKVNQ
jgi:hypothetical protein